MSSSCPYSAKHWLRASGGVALLTFAGYANAQAAAAADAGTEPAPEATAQQVAQADTAPSTGEEAASSGGIAEVVVTSQRREERLQDVPSSISVVGADDLISDRVGLQAGEVTRYIPNASAAASSGHGRPRWWIRGVGTGAQAIDQQSPVGLYYDDVYISNPVGTGGPLFDLERVEVLRGPQGTLWGKNTTGGAINFISKKPDFVPDGYLYVDYGKYNDQVLQGAYGGALGDSDRFAARASFHHQTRDGVKTNLYTGDNEQPITESAARVQLLARLTDSVEFLAKGHVRTHASRGYGFTVIGTNPDGSYWTNGIPEPYIPSTNLQEVSLNAPALFQIDQAGLSGTLTAPIGNLSLTSITAWEDFSSRTQQDADNTPLELSRSFAQASSTQFSQEIRLASPKEDRLNWVAGAHYFWEQFDQLTTQGRLDTKDKPTTSPTLYNTTTVDHETDSVAVFGSTTFNFTDAFALTGGLRWTSETRKIDLLRLGATNVIFNDPGAWWRKESLDPSTPLNQQAVQVDENTWEDWGYDLVPEYKITDNARTFFRYARGFRSGGFNSSAISQATVTVIEPEYLTSYELGFKSEWLGNRLILNSAVFYYDYEDIQINVVRATPTGAASLLTNAGEGRGYGAELEIQALPFDSLSIKSSFGWLDTKFTEFQDGDVNRAGAQFVRSPDFTAVIGADYTLTLEQGQQVIFGTSWNYQGKQFFYTVGQNFPALNQDKDYTIGNARIAYVTANGKLTLTGYVNNLTDEDYKVHTSQATAGSSPGGAGVLWSEPRTYGASLTLRF